MHAANSVLSVVRWNSLLPLQESCSSTGSFTNCQNHGATPWPGAKPRSRKIFQTYPTKTNTVPIASHLAYFGQLFSHIFADFMCFWFVWRAPTPKVLIRSPHQNLNYFWGWDNDPDMFNADLTFPLRPVSTRSITCTTSRNRAAKSHRSLHHLQTRQKWQIILDHNVVGE